MVLKILQTVFLASFKYLFTLPYALLIGLDYKIAVASLLFGGIGGFLFFYYLYKPVVSLLLRVKPVFCQYLPKNLEPYCIPGKQISRNITISRKTRFLARLKSNYGMWGLIISTPLFLSVPLGAFLVRRYYSRRRNVVFYMIVSFVGWTILYSGIIFLFPGFFLK